MPVVAGARSKPVVRSKADAAIAALNVELVTLREERSGPDGGTRGSRKEIATVRVQHPVPSVRRALAKRMAELEAPAQKNPFVTLHCSADGSTTTLVQVRCTSLTDRDYDHEDPSAGGGSAEPVVLGFVARIDGTELVELSLADVLAPGVDLRTLHRACETDGGRDCGSADDYAHAPFAIDDDALLVCTTHPCIGFSPREAYVRDEILRLLLLDR